jgi:hypothetical protein
MPIALKLIWKTQNDKHVCPVCKALEGYTWVLAPGDLRPKLLSHPVYGPVYDTRPAADGSLVQGAKGHVCRCTLKQEFQVSNRPISKIDVDTK